MSQQAKANQAAFAIGQMTHRMAEGYFMHLAAMQVARDPRAEALLPSVQPGQIVPVMYVGRKDDSQHIFHFRHYLAEASSNPAMVHDLERVWFVGARLAIGDALQQHHYFDRAPELELIRHLRNGVAHGNVFRIHKPNSLASYPAHNRLAWVRSDSNAEFEITRSLQHQPVLFDFMGPGDILDLLMSVSLYLTRMGNGDPLRP